MNNKRNIKKELEEISPFLANLKKKDNSFGVPEDYFQKMQREVFQKIKADDISQTAKAPSFFGKIIADSIQIIQTLLSERYFMPVASFLVLMATGVYFLKPEVNSSTVNEDNMPLFADVSVEEIGYYIEENIDDFEIEELTDFIDIATITDVNTENSKMLKTSKEEIFDPELDDYIDEIIDEFDIDELEDIL